MMPPLITVGSRPAASSRVATSEVVVVLPCVPATATHCLRRISSASISARRTTGMRRARRDELRIIALDRGRDDDDGRFSQIGGVMADEHLRPVFAQALDVRIVA